MVKYLQQAGCEQGKVVIHCIGPVGGVGVKIAQNSGCRLNSIYGLNYTYIYESSNVLEDSSVQEQQMKNNQEIKM